jgi:hypothetical protein
VYDLPMIGVTLRISVDRDAQAVYDTLVDPSAATKFLQAVKSYQLLGEGWSTVGDKRLITLYTGTTMIEKIKNFAPPHHFSYEITEINTSSSLINMLITRGISQCWFRANKSGGTQLTWRFSYQPRTLLIVPLLWVFMHTAYRSFMKTAMKKMSKKLN